MSNVFWIQTLEGRNYSGESDDLGVMADLVDDIDSICEELGVKKISDFLDTTDMEFSYLNDGEGGEIDPETGLSYGIDSMEWFDIDDGIKTMRAIKEAMRGGSLDLIENGVRGLLLEEIDDCLSRLIPLKKAGGKFHLAAIM